MVLWVGLSCLSAFLLLLSENTKAPRNAKECRRYKRRRKLKAKARLKEVLAMAREVLGYKPLRGMLGKKLSPEHKAALHEGRRRQARAMREKKALKNGQPSSLGSLQGTLAHPPVEV
jgi:hypothetical protein